MLASVQQDSTPTTEGQPAVQVYTLGRFKVVVRGHALEDQAWRRKTARKLFKILLSRPGRRMPRDELIELIWPDSDPDTSSTNFRSTIHALRKALDGAQAPHGLGIVFRDRDSVWLRADVELWVDADAFESSVEQALTAADPLPLLKRADNLYSGDYLPDDSYEDWAARRRDSLKQLWTELQTQLAKTLDQSGDTDAAVSHLQELVHIDPCDERSARELMRLYGRHGRRSDAIRAYQRLVQALREELDVDPSAETVGLSRQIVAGATSFEKAGVASRFVCTYPFPVPKTFVGCAGELGVLSRALSMGRTAGRGVLLGGPAGTGKSALLGAMVQQAEAQGFVCLAGGCYEGHATAPLGPFHDALADYLLSQPVERLQTELGNVAGELARVVPELRYKLDFSQEAVQAASQLDRMQVFGAIHAFLRQLTERSPTLLCLEDLHAADEATLQLFHFLLRQTRRLPIVLVATYRSDEAPADQSLAQTLATITRERLAEHVVLRALDSEETAELASALLDGPASQYLAESLYATTEGNPLFLEQIVLAMSESGLLSRQDGAWDPTGELQRTPPIVRDVIEQRLARLPSSCRQALSTASVLGQRFEHATLLDMLEGRDEHRLLVDLDRAMAASVIHEAPGGYAFHHALLRETLHRSLTAPRRMLLHGRAGNTLERRFGRRAMDHSAELAHHFLLGGEAETTRTKALRYSMEAGRRAAELSSYSEALMHYANSWELIEREGSPDPTVRLAALEGRGWAELELARWRECVASYEQARALSADPIHRARACNLIAFVKHHTGQTEEALAECAAGLSELEGLTSADAVEVRLRIQQQVAIVSYLKGSYGSIVQLGQEMVAQAQQLFKPRSIAGAHLVLAWGYMGLGDVDSAFQEYSNAVAAAEQFGERVYVATTYENVGFQHYLAGSFASAKDYLHRALKLYRESASELRGVNTLQHLCRVWIAEGDLERAREQAKRAVELETGGQERWAADGLQILGDIALLSAEWELARINLQQALSIRGRVGDTAGQVESLVSLGVVNQHSGRWAEAEDAFTRAVAAADSMDPSPPVVLAHRALGRFRMLMGDAVEAKREIEFAFQHAQSIRETLEYAPTVLAMAELEANSGQLSDAIDLARQALQVAKAVAVLSETHSTLAALYIETGDLPRGAAHAAEALSEAERLGSPHLICLAHLSAAGGPSEVASVDTGLRYAARSGIMDARVCGLTAARRAPGSQ